LFATGRRWILAIDLFEQFQKDFSEDLKIAQIKYEGPATLLPMDAAAFLKNAKRELKTLESHKIQSYECSSFSYSAISDLLLNNSIRRHFDILQVGTMQVVQSTRKNFAHK
jgi:hypothetical protein